MKPRAMSMPYTKPSQPLADVDEVQWDAVMGVNLKGVWLCMKYEIPAMLAGGGGAIVNVASIYGLKPSDVGHGPYAASKHGVVGLTRSAATDYGQMNLRINAVAPGFTRSEMVDPQRPGGAEHYGRMVARHCALNVPVALTEALSNAILRGNNEDRHKHVRVRARLDYTTIVLEVADEGEGFDLDDCTIDPTTGENVLREDGRGLFLMRRLMDRVERFSDHGNVVRLTLRRA